MPGFDERTTGEGEPQGTPVNLTRDELWSMQRALVGRIMLYPFETALETALSKVGEALKTPKSDEHAPEVQEPLYTLTDLSARDVERLEQALRMLRRTFTRESPMYAEVSALGYRVSGLK